MCPEFIWASLIVVNYFGYQYICKNLACEEDPGFFTRLSNSIHRSGSQGIYQDPLLYGARNRFI